MSAHDPETAAAAYLGGVMTAAERADHEAHLLGCEDCWSEVEQGRRGRRWAEDARDLAPAGLHDRLRAAVLDAATGAPAGPDEVRDVPGPRRLSRGRRVLTLAAAVGAVVAVGALGLSLTGGATSGLTTVASVQAAVDGFRAERLPGDGTPTLAVPDLAAVGLAPMGAAAGDVGGEQVTGFAYADATGRRVTVYLSEAPFPRIESARSLTGDADGPWLAQEDGVVLLCARLPHAMLLVGEDAALVRAAAEQLDAV